MKDTSIDFSSAKGRTRTEDVSEEQSEPRPNFVPHSPRDAKPLFCDVIKTAHLILGFMLLWFSQSGRFTPLQSLRSDCLNSIISSKQ